MKKILIAIVVIFVLLSNVDAKQNFSLLNYFSGEYYAYSLEQENSNSLYLGFCYETQDKVVNKKIGESIVVKNLEPIEAINKLKAKIVKTEYLDDGTTVIYAYSSLINDRVEINGLVVNLQIAHKQDYSVVGWPVILGSF